MPFKEEKHQFKRFQYSFIAADVDDEVFWLFADRITSNLGSARQAIVFNSVRNIPSIKLMCDRLDFQNWCLLYF